MSSNGPTTHPETVREQGGRKGVPSTEKPLDTSDVLVMMLVLQSDE